jgi:hypothetical protein
MMPPHSEGIEPTKNYDAPVLRAQHRAAAHRGAVRHYSCALVPPESVSCAASEREQWRHPMREGSVTRCGARIRFTQPISTTKGPRSYSRPYPEFRNGAIQPVRQAGWGAGDRKVQPRGTYSTQRRRAASLPACCAASPGRGDARRLRRAIDARALMMLSAVCGRLSGVCRLLQRRCYGRSNAWFSNC